VVSLRTDFPMPKDAKTTQPLLETALRAAAGAGAADVSSESDQTETDVAQAVAPLSQWEILKFIMMTPMSCSWMTAVLLIFVGIVSSVGTGISLAFYAIYTGQLNSALRSRQYDRYDDAVEKLIFIIIGTMATQGLSTYCMKRIGLMKRIHLNQRFHSDYFSGNKYYILNAFYSDRCDSVDSRLTSDIETMTYEFFGILQVLIYCLAAFIYGVANLRDANLALIGLGCMVLLTVIVNVILKIVSSRVSSRVSDLKRDEGLFSFQHSRIKKNSESIAFYGGQSLELQKIKQMFESVLRSARLVIKGQGILDFTTFFYAAAMSSSFPMWIGTSPHPQPPFYLVNMHPSSLCCI
jgi:putative ATP-binding cassette transporter